MRKTRFLIIIFLQVIFCHSASAQNSSSGNNEKMPEFPGGQDKLVAYIHAKYPDDKRARRKGIEGDVTVKFVINEDGSVTNPVIIKSLYPSLDTAAIRLVLAMPEWTPGEQNGKKVKVSFTLPVSFSVDR